jgi:hypothetical protein
MAASTAGCDIGHPLTRPPHATTGSRIHFAVPHPSDSTDAAPHVVYTMATVADSMPALCVSAAVADMRRREARVSWLASTRA